MKSLCLCPMRKLHTIQSIQFQIPLKLIRLHGMQWINTSLGFQFTIILGSIQFVSIERVKHVTITIEWIRVHCVNYTDNNMNGLLHINLLSRFVHFVFENRIWHYVYATKIHFNTWISFVLNHLKLFTSFVQCTLGILGTWILGKQSLKIHYILHYFRPKSFTIFFETMGDTSV